jgi:hypothetical protein
MRLQTPWRLNCCPCSRTGLRPLREVPEQSPGPFRANPLQRLNGTYVKYVLPGNGRVFLLQIVQELLDASLGLQGHSFRR